MREKEPKFGPTEIDEKQEQALEMDKEAEEIVEKGEAKAPQEAIERIEEKELKELIDLKAEDAYEKNNVVRFTNAAFLDDIFVTKNEFKGNAMLVMKDSQDYDRYYNEQLRSYPRLPQGRATLAVLIDEVYEGFRVKGQKVDPRKTPESLKNRFWSLWIEDHTDWVGTGVDYRDYEIRQIKRMKKEAFNRRDFANKMREHVIEEFNLKPESPPDDERLKSICIDKDYFLKPGNLRKYLHGMAGMRLKKDSYAEQELKSGRDVFRSCHIGMLVSVNATRDYGHFARRSWGKFNNLEEIDVSRDLRGIICTVRDRVFEKKVIDEMIELTKDNPEARAPVFDLDGNQIWPTRRKREEIEEEIRQKQEAAMEELEGQGD